MNTRFPITAGILALSAAPLLAQDVRIALPNSDPATFAGSYGNAVAALGDWLNSTTPDYAVSDPTDTGGGPLAGLIRIYDGATGAVVRTVAGTGSTTSCTGSPVGDALGEQMTMIDDCDGDGRSELLATRRLAPLTVSGCVNQAGHGGFMIVFSNPATPNFLFTAPTQAGLGVAIARIAPSGGLPQFVVSTATGSVQVWRKQAGSQNPVQVGTVAGFGQTASALCGAGVIGGVPAFAVNGPGQVFVKTTAGTTVATFSQPLGTAFGTSLAFLDDPGFESIVIGEPLFGGNVGRVHVGSLAGGVVVQTLTGSSGSFLGAIVATGGDVNADGLTDFLASTAAGNQTLIANRNGITTARGIALPLSGGTVGTMQSMSISPDMTSDGFVDVVFGGTFSGRRSWVYYGGPEARLDIVGSSCSQSGPALPSLQMNSIPVVGSAPQFFLFGSTPASFSGLLAGTADPVGTVIPPGSCSVFLALTPPPITGFSTFTDANGAWVSPTVPIPRALGAAFGFQAVTISAGPGNPLEFSNALNLVIGW